MMLYGKLSAVLRRCYEAPLSVATPTRHAVSTSAGWSADPKESWPLAPADVFRDEVLERKSTAGRPTPAYTLQSRPYMFTASEKAPTTRRGAQVGGR